MVWTMVWTMESRWPRPHSVSDRKVHERHLNLRTSTSTRCEINNPNVTERWCRSVDFTCVPRYQACGRIVSASVLWRDPELSIDAMDSQRRCIDSHIWSIIFCEFADTDNGTIIEARSRLPHSITIILQNTTQQDSATGILDSSCQHISKQLLTFLLSLANPGHC